ncbi:MAG: hypothetical protein FJ096_10480 [Deltaproteobacteria bacterium]|nr:hypothetical protein [Deltaproteobacteria bacterium]
MQTRDGPIGASNFTSFDAEDDREGAPWNGFIASLFLFAGVLVTRPLLGDEIRPFGPVVLHRPIRERRVEQGVLRPVPLVVALPIELDRRAQRVLVHYRLWGVPDWTAIELRRVGVEFHGAIPCLEVGSVSGPLRYYVRVHDERGKVIATGASRASPHVIAVKQDRALDATASQVAKCPDPGDCPPGLPGCPSERVVALQCHDDEDCEGGETCGFRGLCEKTQRRYHQVGVAIAQDFGLFDASAACALPAQEHEGTSCHRDDGAPYIGNPAYVARPLAVGQGMTRVVAAYDRVVAENTLVGVRVGWAFLGEATAARGAASFIPLSVGLRVAFATGEDPFVRPGLRPYGFVTAGFGQFDIAARTRVREIPSAPSFQGGNDLVQSLAVHKRAGDAFVGVGGGLGYAFEGGIVPGIELSVVDAFPFGAVVVGGSAGAMVAF